MRRLLKIQLIMSVLLLSGAASAEKLTLLELDVFAGYLKCKAGCQGGSSSELGACLQACGKQNERWEKDGKAGIDEADLSLAILEYWDDGEERAICYESGAVVPVQLCGAVDCLSEGKDAAACADMDGDGLRRHEEEGIGTSDSEFNAECSPQAAEVCGFTHECLAFPEPMGNRCVPRKGENSGTVFHLYKVEENNNELVVHLYYDYSPIPATVLDLLVEYDQNALQLLDARPLKGLKEAQKELSVTHTSTGKLRLVVLGALSPRPIPFGPIIELVFNRLTGQQTKVGFSKKDADQEMSMAPDVGEAKEQLKNDALWGDDINVGAREPNGKRILLYYDFENPNDFLAYEDTKSPDELCALMADCSQLSEALPYEEQQKQRLLSRLGTLQRGAVSYSETLEGVIGKAVYMDGRTDHLELPVTLNDPEDGESFDSSDQSFTFSTWFYAEGGESPAANPHGQVLFSQNNSLENTEFGVRLEQSQSSPEDGRLVWFQGDMGFENSTYVIAEKVPARTWTHLALALNDKTNQATFYVDGVFIKSIAFDFKMQCPQPENNDTGLVIHKEGDLPAGYRAPEVLMFASAHNNLYGIEQMELSGLARTEVLRKLDSSAQDPDYSPVLDKIVYSSNAAGNFEIWVADGDGSDARQITFGFGDTERGLFARRPKWAPDGSGIVFESNIYDIPLDDNWLTTGYQLYYIGYDALRAEVAIPLPTGDNATSLDYEFLASNQIVDDYRLTSTEDFRNHYEAVWLEGRTEKQKGVIVYNTADERYESKEVYRLVIPSDSARPNPTAVLFPAAPKPDDPKATDAMELGESMLAAMRIKPAGQPETSRLLYQKEWITFETSDQFSITGPVETTRPTVEGEMQDAYVVKIVHTPEDYDDSECWDLNRNGACDDNENKNGDAECTVADCYPVEVDNLFLRFNSDAYAADIKVSSPGAEISVPTTLNPAITEEAGLAKDVELAVSYTSTAPFVKIRVLSPVNNKPIPADTEIAEIVFRPRGKGAAGLRLEQRRRYQKFFIKDLVFDEAKPFEVDRSQLEQVSQAVFSPDGKRLALAGIQGARPVVVVTQDLAGTHDLDKISTLPMRVEGMDWTSMEAYYPCHWIGGFKDPTSKLFGSAFEGGLDEIKLYSYVRNAKAIASEAARGKAWLEKTGRDGELSKREQPCITDLDCPPYELCDLGQCNVHPCDPDDANSCEVGRGQCTLMPVPVGLEHEESFEWVCAVECDSDRRCFEQECLNGPCRFCDIGTRSCNECRWTQEKLSGEITLEYIEGCPDRNSFMCQDGSCLTECYEFENGEAVFLCDPALEFCNQGRCQMFEWEWNDFAPATFNGLGEVQYENGDRYTTAIDQSYPVEIKAFGVEDYLTPPEIIVEGKYDKAYDGEWFDIGTVRVYNKNEVEAGINPYVVNSPHPITELRLRLISPPYENHNAGSTGLMHGAEQHFCCSHWSADGTQCLERDPGACTYRPTGSRATIGYPVGIPTRAARKACAERGLPNCNYVKNEEKDDYLWGGHHAVIVTGVRVNDADITPKNNLVCSYEGEIEPVEKTTVGDKQYVSKRRRLFFGDIRREISNQKDHFFSDYAKTTQLIERVSNPIKPPTWWLLNCTLADQNSETKMARIQFQVCSGKTDCNSLYKTSGRVGTFTETANACLIEKGTRTAPCYEWIGGDVSMDYMIEEPEIKRTLEFETFRSFGYDQE